MNVYYVFIVVLVLETLVGQKEGVFYLLELKDQWGSQTIISYANECAIAPVTRVIRGVTIKFANLPLCIYE